MGAQKCVIQRVKKMPGVLPPGRAVPPRRCAADSARAPRRAVGPPTGWPPRRSGQRLRRPRGAPASRHQPPPAFRNSYPAMTVDLSVNMVEFISLIPIRLFLAAFTKALAQKKVYKSGYGRPVIIPPMQLENNRAVRENHHNDRFAGRKPVQPFRLQTAVSIRTVL